MPATPNLYAGLQSALRNGLRGLDGEACRRVRDFVASQALPDGGFRGRSKSADPYYTAFGLELAAALGMDGEIRRHAGYVRRLLGSPVADPVAAGSLVRCRLITELRAGAPDLFSADPAEPFSPKNAYDLYLLLLVLDAAATVPEDAAEWPSAEDVPNWFGPAEIPAPGNDDPTSVLAAGLCTRSRLRQQPDTTALEALRNRRRKDGGFPAHPLAPSSDLLSTAVALNALQIQGCLPDSMREPARDYVAGLWNEDGGFSSTDDDPVSDIEYTWYAMLALGCR